MKTESNIQQDTYLVLGEKLRIRFNERTEEREDMEGETTTFYIYDEAVCHVKDDRDTIIEKIIGSKYTTGAEFACINNGGEDYEQYQQFRQQAKELADGWFAQES
jgi:hypothetical protein